MSTTRYAFEGFESTINDLPPHVLSWFESRYPYFKQDHSYHNDDWPVFCVCTVQRQGEAKHVFLSLTSDDWGEDSPAGYSIKLCDDEDCPYDGYVEIDSCFGTDEGSDFCSVADIDWLTMMDTVDTYLGFEGNKPDGSPCDKQCAGCDANSCCDTQDEDDAPVNGHRAFDILKQMV